MSSQEAAGGAEGPEPALLKVIPADSASGGRDCVFLLAA